MKTAKKERSLLQRVRLYLLNHSQSKHSTRVVMVMVIMILLLTISVIPFLISPDQWFDFCLMSPNLDVVCRHSAYDSHRHHSDDEEREMHAQLRMLYSLLSSEHESSKLTQSERERRMSEDGTWIEMAAQRARQKSVNPRQWRYLFFQHVRKAGGSTLCRRLWQSGEVRGRLLIDEESATGVRNCRVTNKHISPFRLARGDIAVLHRYLDRRRLRLLTNEYQAFPLRSFLSDFARWRRTTVMMTNLRDPIEQSLSEMINGRATECHLRLDVRDLDSLDRNELLNCVIRFREHWLINPLTSIFAGKWDGSARLQSKEDRRRVRVESQRRSKERMRSESVIRSKVGLNNDTLVLLSQFRLESSKLRSIGIDMDSHLHCDFQCFRQRPFFVFDDSLVQCSRQSLWQPSRLRLAKAVLSTFDVVILKDSFERDVDWHWPHTLGLSSPSEQAISKAEQRVVQPHSSLRRIDYSSVDPLLRTLVSHFRRMDLDLWHFAKRMNSAILSS